MVFFPIFFIVGYVFIALEQQIKINKSATALLLGSGLWFFWFLHTDPTEASVALTKAMSDIVPILFFLIGAMSIVAVIDAHQGFTLITSRAKTNNRRILLWLLTLVTFGLSALLDNMTTTIVMATLANKLLTKKNDKLFFAGMIVIAANAGGAFSPIGDVTTTMLWIGGQISASGIVRSTFFASAASLLVPLLVITPFIKGNIRTKEQQNQLEMTKTKRRDRDITFIFGIGGLLLVPVLKALFSIPPYIGMMLALGFLWLVTDIILKHSDDKTAGQDLEISTILKSIDLSSIMFFAGILLAVDALASAGYLTKLATFLNSTIGNIPIITIIIGFLSSVIDNVPLVAAFMNMYSMATYPIDSFLWPFLAFCAGTGGSLLIIRSAAGVAAMSISKISFGWYMRRMTPIAFLSYATGIGVYLLQQLL